MSFYTFTQNNSGGGFSGPAHYVIVEAENGADADDAAENVGVYFDDEYVQDCECCGTRWSRAWAEGEKVPTIYGTPVEDYDFDGGLSFFRRDTKDLPQAIVVYKNGEVANWPNLAIETSEPTIILGRERK